MKRSTNKAARSAVCALLAAAFVSSASICVCADYDYSEYYDYTSSSTDPSEYYSDASSSVDSSGYYGDTSLSDDSASFYSGYYVYGEYRSDSDGYEQSDPAVVSLKASDITSDSFTVKLTVTSETYVTAADITVSYDAETVELVSDSANEALSGAETVSDGEGKARFKYDAPYGTESLEECLTLDFKKTDASARSTVLYISVDELKGMDGAMSYTADGTVVGFEMSEADQHIDESMYTEVRIDASSGYVSFESLGIENVMSVELENTAIAAADSEKIEPLSEGVTNMIVTFADESAGYYRLVVYPAQSAEDSSESVTVSAEEIIDFDSQEESDVGFSKKTASIIIYIVVLLALAAIAAEYVMLVGNPYAKTAELLKQRRRERSESRGSPEVYEDDMFPQEYDVSDTDISASENGDDNRQE